MADPIPQGSWLRGLNVERQTRIADGSAAALAISLPWSTSATSLLALLWLIAVIPLLDLTTLRREISTPAGGFPVLLWVLGVIGMLWAVDVPFKERLGGLSSFHKLLFIPLLMIQFRRSTRGAWVLIGYLASCSARFLSRHGPICCCRCFSGNRFRPGASKVSWSKTISPRTWSLWFAPSYSPRLRCGRGAINADGAPA